MNNPLEKLHSSQAALELRWHVALFIVRPAFFGSFLLLLKKKNLTSFFCTTCMTCHFLWFLLAIIEKKNLTSFFWHNMHDMPWHSLFCHRRAWLVALVSAVLLALPHTGCSLTAPAPPSSEVSTRNSAVARCRAKASLLRSHVFWAAPFFSGGGYCSEAHDATSGLAKCGVPVQLLPHGDSFNRAFTERLGQDRQNELQQWTVRSLPTRPPRRGEDSQPPTICICHSEPGAWSVPRPNYHTADCPAPGCDYKIGRTMFETDRLPHGWAPRLNAMDELWVPTECQRQVFASNGVVPSKIHVVGESVDSAFFDPSSVQPYFIPARVLQQSSAFGRVVDPAVPPFSDSTVVLLSVFKWEARKAPEVLVKA